MHVFPRVRITHYLPSGQYQVAMVPYIKVTCYMILVTRDMVHYIKDENDTMVPMAPPSCSTRLVRVNLGQYALHITFFLLFTVIAIVLVELFYFDTDIHNIKRKLVKSAHQQIDGKINWKTVI